MAPGRPFSGRTATLRFASFAFLLFDFPDEKPLRQLGGRHAVADLRDRHP